MLKELYNEQKKKSKDKKIQAFCFVFFAILVLFTGCHQQESHFKTDKQLEELQEESSMKEESQTKENSKTGKNSETEKLIYVYICGAVQKPGVYALQERSRIYQVLEKAGGFTAEADQTFINQAQILEDGMQIIVYTKDQAEEARGGLKDSQTSQKATAFDNKKVNINQATMEELTTLKGIGDTRARAIIAYRNEQGPFTTIEELMEIEGIKEGLFQKIKEQITV